MKTVGILVLIVATLLGAMTVLTVIDSTLNEGYVPADGARIYASVAGLLGERHAVARVNLLNRYGRIAVEGNTLTLAAGFLSAGSLDVSLPRQFQYTATEFSGRGACIIKRQDTITIRAPPCR